MNNTLIKADWPAPANVHAYTTTKRFGDLSGSETATQQQLIETLHLPTKPLWLTQVHGADVIQNPPSQANGNTPHPSDSTPTADGSYTNRAKEVCVIRTADCLPILICNQQGTEVAALHGGWRSLAAGIMDNAIKLFQSKSEELLVWLGPAIGPHAFEVGKDVYKAFTQQNPTHTLAFKQTSEEKWLANIYEIAKQQLNHHNITNITGGTHCTHTDQAHFYSHRKNKTKGRLATLIWLG